MLKMKTSLYNNDGTLSAQAQSLLSPKPDDMSMGEWRKVQKQFRSQLSKEDLKEFNLLRKKARAKQASKNWRSKNSEKTKGYSKKWREANPEKTNRDHKSWRTKNSESLKQYRKNSESLKRYRNNYHKQRKAKDPLYRLQCNMRIMGNRVIKQLSLDKKPASTFKWVGCSPEELKARFESLFVEGMSWDNYGEWHVDHIRPVSSFKPEEWEQINHYTNLQPLWAEDNLVKRNYFV